jgi:adenosylcobinamide-phosphate synthase
MLAGLALLLSLGIDALGEPPARVHPVVWMGWYLRLKNRLLRASSRPWVQLALGAGFVLVGALACGVAAWWLGHRLTLLPWPAATVLLALLLKPLFSLSALLKAGDAVRGALAAQNLPEARRLLGWHLVSRDTSELSESEVAGAAVASLAENLTDSVVAPLFYFAVFGLPGAAVYRFVNTADAVLGYRTPELEHFGKFAARTDDVLNFVPARLAAVLLRFALTLYRVAPARLSWRQMLADRRRIPSPNGGWTMALTAAGLNVKLTKRGVYALNETGRDATPADIGYTQRLVKVTVALGAGLHALVLLGADCA